MNGGWCPPGSWTPQVGAATLPVRVYQQAVGGGPLLLVPTFPVEEAPIELDFPPGVPAFDASGQLTAPGGPLRVRIPRESSFPLMTFPMDGGAIEVWLTGADDDAEWFIGGIVLRGVRMELRFAHSGGHSVVAHLTGGVLALDRRLAISPAAPSASGLPPGQIDLAVSSAETIPLLGGRIGLGLTVGARVRLSVLPCDPFILVYSRAGGAASVTIPALPEAAGDTVFRFTLDSHDVDAFARGEAERTVLRWAPAGLTAAGTIDRKKVSFSGNVGAVMPETGNVRFSGRTFDATVSGKGNISQFFPAGEGRFELAASTQEGCVTATFHADLARRWEAWGGWLALEEPHIDVKITLLEKRFDARLTFGGTLVLTTKGAADSFIHDLFDDTRIPIGPVKLDDVLSSLHPLPVHRPPEARLGPLIVTLARIGLSRETLSVGGTLRVSVPDGIRAEGTLPDVTVNLAGGVPAFAVGGLRNLALSVELPGGTSAHGAIERSEERFIGSVALAIPGVPGIDLLVDIDQSAGFPAIYLHAEVGVAIPVFTGAVLANPGVGLGINRRFRALAEGALPHSDELGALHPEDADQWMPDRSHHALMIDSWVVPTREIANGTLLTPAPYALHAFLMIDDQANLLAVVKGWALVKFKDLVDTDRPLLVAAMALRPRAATLEIRATTMPDPKLDADVPMLKDALSAVQVGFHLLASPQRFELAIGPIRLEKKVGGFLAVRGDALFGALIHRGQLAVVSVLDVEARVDADIHASVFALTIDAGAHLHFHMTSMMAGGLLDGTMALYGRLAVRGSVDLSLSVTLHVEIHIHIHAWFVKIDIDLSFDIGFSFHFALSTTLDAAVGLYGSEFGFHGEATLGFSILGFDVALGLSVGSNTDVLGDHKCGKFIGIATALGAA